MDAFEGLEMVLRLAAVDRFRKEFWANQDAGRHGSRDDGSRTRRAKARDLGRRAARAAKFAPVEA